MSRRRLKSGDKVKLSVHGLLAKITFQETGIFSSTWMKAVSRNEKDTYLVDTTIYTTTGTYVRLGNLYRKGPFKFLKRKKGPLTGYRVKRDWIKFAK